MISCPLSLCSKWKVDKHGVKCVCCHDDRDLLLTAGCSIKMWNTTDHSLVKVRRGGREEGREGGEGLWRDLEPDTCTHQCYIQKMWLEGQTECFQNVGGAKVYTMYKLFNSLEGGK